MRSAVADFEVIEALDPSVEGRARYVCRAPGRLTGVDRVMVTEVGVDAGGWNQLAERLTRWAAVDIDQLMEVLETGPDLDPDGAGVYLVSEFASGGRLADPVDELGVVGRVQALISVAQAAHALHQAGQTHGGISADSIWLAERGAVLAPPAMDGEAGVVTRVGPWRNLTTICPDLLRGEQPSRASDIWSLGATLHLALSDRPLYRGIDGDEPVTAVQRVLFTEPDVDPDLPPELAETISACLAADPARRPTTGLELAERLRVAEVSL